MMSKWRKIIMAIIKTGHRGWNHSGVKVVDNAAAPIIWTVLNLSAVVGKNTALVFIKVKNVNSSGSYACSFRTNGATEDIGRDYTYAGGTSLANIENGKIVYMLIETDESGIIEWKCTANHPADIWVLGYIR